MTKFILAFACILCLYVTGWSQAFLPNDKVSEAFTSDQISAMSAEDILQLNVRSEKLCSFENVKNPNAPAYQLSTINGTAVVLSPEEFTNFNPLLYNLPQQDLACENLLITTTDGVAHLLVVKSRTMMENEVKRYKVKHDKQQAK